MLLGSGKVSNTPTMPRKQTQPPPSNIPLPIRLYLQGHRKAQKVFGFLRDFLSPDPWEGLGRLGVRNYFPIKHEAVPFREDELGRIIPHSFKAPAVAVRKSRVETAPLTDEEKAFFARMAGDPLEGEPSVEDPLVVPELTEVDMETLQNLWASGPEAA